METGVIELDRDLAAAGNTDTVIIDVDEPQELLAGDVIILEGQVSETTTEKDQSAEWPDDLSADSILAKVEEINQGQSKRNRFSENNLVMLAHMLSEPTREYHISELFALVDGTYSQKRYALRELKSKLATHNLGFKILSRGKMNGQRFWLSTGTEPEETPVAEQTVIEPSDRGQPAIKGGTRGALKDPRWSEPSACKEKDTERFYKDDATKATTMALASCLGCQAIVPCLEYSLGAKEEFGVWGGLTEKQRKKIRKAQSKGDGKEEVAQMVESMHKENKERVEAASLNGAK